jgi:cell division protein FtsW
LLPHKHWTKLSIPVMVLAVLLLLILNILMSGQRQLINGSVSPVELAKLAVVIYIGHWLSSKGEMLRKLPYGLLPFTIMVGLIAGLVVVNGDISEAVIIVLVASAMFFLAGADVVQFLIGIGGGLVFALRSAMSAVMDRIEPFLKYWPHPLESTNTQLTYGLVALGSGGVFGVGPGLGRLKYLWLPFHTDSTAAAGASWGSGGWRRSACSAWWVMGCGLRAMPDAWRLLAAGTTCRSPSRRDQPGGDRIDTSGTAMPFISVGGSSLVTDDRGDREVAFRARSTGRSEHETCGVGGAQRTCSALRGC